MIIESEQKSQEKQETSKDGKQPKEVDYVKWMREATNFEQLGMLFENTVLKKGLFKIFSLKYMTFSKMKNSFVHQM